MRCGLKGRESCLGESGSRDPSGRNDGSPFFPGHRPSASALGWDLPTRWAGRGNDTFTS